MTITVYIAVQPWDYRTAEVESFASRDAANAQCKEWEQEHPQSTTFVAVQQIEVVEPPSWRMRAR